MDPKLLSPGDVRTDSDSASRQYSTSEQEGSGQTQASTRLVDPFSYCRGNPIHQTDPDGAEPKPIGRVYVIEGELNGKPVVYTGSTAQELRKRFSTHEWRELIRAQSTKISVREVQADLNVAASGRGTYPSARNEALRAGEQKVINEVAEEQASTGRTALNKQRAATEPHAESWEKAHNVSVGKATVWKAAGSAFAIANVLDAYKIALELRMQEQGLVRVPIVLEDQGGTFTVRYTGLIFRDYFKEYLSGPEKGKSVGISEDEAFFYQRESRALFGDVDWKGDFIPGLLAPEPLEVHTGPVASGDQERKEAQRA